jgi:hypothetical protein
MILTSLLRKTLNAFPLSLSHRILKESWNIIEMGFPNIVGLSVHFFCYIKNEFCRRSSFYSTPLSLTAFNFSETFPNN